MSEIFYAGAAKEDITPKIGALLSGYVPDSVSTSIHDPLNVTATAFRDGDTTALLLTFTLGAIQTTLTDQIRGEISMATSVPVRNIIAAATHTHSGPSTMALPGWGDVDTEYVNSILMPAALKAAKAAIADLQPAEMAVGVTESKVGINRMQQHQNGEIKLGQNPWGPYDPNMTCIALRNSETKKGILNMIHYGCHGTSAGDNREISRDWSGVMCDRMEAETGTLTAFYNGAIGDVGPRLTNGKTTGNIKYTEELGGVAATDGMRAYKEARVFTPVKLSLAYGNIRLPRKPLLPLEETKSKIEKFKEPEKLINIERREYSYYKAVLDEYEAGCPEYETHCIINQTVLKLGDVSIIPCPFEPFAEIVMRMRAYSKSAHTLTLSLANGCIGYLPTESQLCRGGYEVKSFLFNTAHPLANNTDQILIEETLRIMEQ